MGGRRVGMAAFGQVVRPEILSYTGASSRRRRPWSKPPPKSPPPTRPRSRRRPQSSPASSRPASMSAAGGSPTSRSRTPATGRRSPAMSCGSACYEPTDELLRRVQRQFGLHDLAIEDAAQRASAAEDRAIRRQPVHRRAHRADGRRPHRLRRDASLRRPRLRGLGAPRRLDLLRGGARSAARPARRCSRTARTTSSTPSSISSSTTTCRCSRRSSTEVEAIEDRVLATALSPAEVERLYTLRRDLAAAAQRDRAARRGLPAARARRGASDRRRRCSRCSAT